MYCIVSNNKNVTFLPFRLRWNYNKGTVEKPAETLRQHRLASHLDRAPNSRSGGHEFESPVRKELGSLTKSGKARGVRSFYSGDPDVITWSCQSVWLRNTRSLARHWQIQIHLPGKLTCPAPLLYTQVQSQHGTGGSYCMKRSLPRHSD